MKSLQKICVIGAGKYGTAVANVCAQHPGIKVTLWSKSEEQVDQINNNRVNQQVFPEFRLPENISAQKDLAEAVKDSNMVNYYKVYVLRFFDVSDFCFNFDIFEALEFVLFILSGFQRTANLINHLLCGTIRRYVPQLKSAFHLLFERYSQFHLLPSSCPPP